MRRPSVEPTTTPAEALRRASGGEAPVGLTIVIVSWNTRELLADCVASIFTTPGADVVRLSEAPARVFPFEVVVVDNGSADGSVEMVRSRFPRVRIIESKENLGFASANNLAIEQSSSRYILLLNPDTEIRPGALEALVGFMDEHPRAGAAGAMLMDTDGALQLSCHPSPSLSRELWRLFHLDTFHPYGLYDMAGWDRHQPRLVDVAQGACLIVRREAFEEVGLLDNDYYIYSEEVDLCERIRQRGWSIYWVPEAKVLHHGGQSTRQVAEAMFLQLYRAKVLYFRKNQSRAAARAYKLILLIAATARLSLAPLAWLIPSTIRRERLVLVRHYLRLVRELPWL